MIYISLLRGINVGGNKKIKMADLKTLYETLGLSAVQTLLQSGNVVFESSLTDTAELTRLLENGIQQQFGFESKIILRTAAAWQALVADAPFSAEQLDTPEKIIVLALQSAVQADLLASLQQTYNGVEKIYGADENLYLYYPDGLGRSKLELAFLERKLKVVGTARNWNTVVKLRDLTLRD